MTENASRRKFLGYIGGVAVGGVLAGGGVYLLGGGDRDKVSSLSQQVTTLQSEVSSLTQQAADSGVLGYLFGKNSYATIDLSRQRLIASSVVTDLAGKNLSFADTRLDSSGRAWAGSVSGGAATLYAIDPAKASLEATVPLPGRWSPALLVDLDPAGKYAYVLNLLIAPNASDADLATLKANVADIVPSVVYKVDTSSKQVVGSLQVARFACDVGIAPDGKYLYLPNQLDKLVTVVDLSTFQVADSISGGVSPDLPGASMNTVSPGSKYLFIEQAPSHNWSGVDIEGPNAEVVVDTGLRKVVKSILLDEPPGIDEFSPDGKYVAVTLRTKVALIDTNTLEIVATVPVNGPGTPTYSPDSRFLLVPAGKESRVAVVDLTTFKETSSIALSFAPSTFIPYDPNGRLTFKLLPASQTG